MKNILEFVFILGDVTYHFQNRGASETTVSFPV